MNRDNIFSKINSTRLCLMAHLDNVKGSEIEDRTVDLEEVLNSLK